MSRYPLAPYFSALNTYISSSKVVRMMILISGYRSLMICVQITPSILGMRMSIRITSGFSFLTDLMTSCPSAAVSVTWKSGMLSKMISRLCLISSWSSAIKILIIIPPFGNSHVSASQFPSVSGSLRALQIHRRLCNPGLRPAFPLSLSCGAGRNRV